MVKKIEPKSFDEALAYLRDNGFDVQESPAAAKRPSGTLVRKYGCGAVIALGPVQDPGKNKKVSGMVIVARPGVWLNGEIATLLDKGYQKFFKTSKLELPATADRLVSLHKFTEELHEAAGSTSLYNEALGTVSDEYMYDRVKGRDHTTVTPEAH